MACWPNQNVGSGLAELSQEEGATAMVVVELPTKIDVRIPSTQSVSPKRTITNDLVSE